MGVNKTKYEYLTSVFDVAHDAGLRTGLYAGKLRFNMEVNSYDAAHSDNGENKIDEHEVDAAVAGNYTTSQTLVNQWKSQMSSKNPLRYSFIHFADTDDIGHVSGWNVTSPTTPYMQAVEHEDAWLGQIIAEVNNTPALKGNTAIVLTADHGGHGNVGPDPNGHSDNTLPADYTVPFYVYTPGLTPRGCSGRKRDGKSVHAER